MPAREIIFFRHSLPLIEPTLHADQWHLSEEGRERARRLAMRLVEYAPTEIISSLEPKAVETAQIVSEVTGIPYRMAAGLHEHLRTQVGYTSREAFEASVQAFFAQPDRLVFGDETADQAYVRFARAVEAAQMKAVGPSPLAIVSHGTVISLYVSRLYGIEPFSVWKSLKLPCMVVLSARQPEIISLEDSIG